MSQTLTTFDGALKQYYTDDAVEDMVYEERPFLAMVPKMEEFYGKNLPIPIIYGNPQGRSGTFSRAQTRGALEYSRVTDFVLTRNHDYGIATIDNETLLATQSSEGAFIEAATTEIDGIINATSNSLAQALVGDGYGVIGQLNGGSVAGATLTLTDISTVVYFEVGMVLGAAASATSGAIRAYGSSGNGLIVTGVNRSTGVLTFGFNANDATNGIPTIGTTDFLFVQGDHDETGSSPLAKLKLTGLAGWLPTTASTSISTTDSFFGVNRSVDPTRLGGQFVDGRALPIEEALINGATLVAREGWSLTHFFMSFNNYANLEKSLGSKVNYVDVGVTANVFFRAMEIIGPNGNIKVVADRTFKDNFIFGLHMPVWKLYSLGKAPRVIDTDGLQMLRQSSNDGVECRYGYYAQLGCRAPGANVGIQMS